jgi:hypothetical protein
MHKYKIVAVALVAGFVLSLVPTPQAEAAFDRNRLIDDIVFDAKSSMSANQIDNFLNTRSNSCISPESGFAAKQPIGYSESTGFQFGDYVSAGKVIYSAAQAYDINPKVLLAKLQNEQSLVQASSSYCNNGNDHKYAAAMGYACPDSDNTYSYSGISLYRRNGVVHSSIGSTCVSAERKAGFSQQIIYAAWFLKFGQQRSMGNIDWAIVRGNWDNSDDPESCYSGPMTRGYRQACPSGSTVFYDGNRTIDGVQTRMSTGGTAALYWYTPHFHGNEVFVEVFEDWFGATRGTPLFRIGDSDPVYILGEDDTYYYIPSQQILEAYGLGTSVLTIKSVSSSYLSGKTFSGNLPPIARFEGSEVYMMDRGAAHHFTSREQLEEFGYNLGDEALLASVTKAYFADDEDMQLTVKNEDGPEVYSIEDGKKRHIIDGEAYLSGSPSYASRPKVHLAPLVLKTLEDGAPILTANKLLKRTSSDTYVYWNGTQRQDVINKVVKELGLEAEYAAKSSIINQLPAGGSTIGKYAKNGDGDLFLFDSRQKFVVSPSKLAAMGLTASDFVLAPDALLDETALDRTFRLIFRIDNGAAVYLIEDGQRQHFNDAAAISEKGFLMSHVINLNPTSGALFPDSGKKILSLGTLFHKADGSVYLVNSDSSSLYIPSRTLMADYGLGFEDVQGMRSVNVTDYPKVGTLGYFAKDSSNNVWHFQRGKERRLVTPAMQAAGFYDLNLSSLPVLQSSTVNWYPRSAGLTDLLQVPGDSRVFKVQNGTKHWITSGEAFESGGFSRDNITHVSNGFLHSLPNGAHIN